MLKHYTPEANDYTRTTLADTTTLSSTASSVVPVLTMKARYRPPLYRWLLYAPFLALTLCSIAVAWREPGWQVASFGLGGLAQMLHGILFYKVSRRLHDEGSRDSPGSHPPLCFLEAFGYGLLSAPYFSFGTSDATMMGVTLSVFALGSLVGGFFHLRERRLKEARKPER